MEMDTYSQGGKLWVQDPEKDPSRNQAWVLGTIDKIDNGSGKLFVKLGSGRGEVVVDTSETGGSGVNSFELANPDDFDTVDDLTELSFLHEPGVLHCLAVRFCEQNLVYTLCGIVLVVINPYAAVPELYGPEKIAEYQAKHIDECDPHIYSVAKKAVDNLQIHGKPQSIIVSGESGAGKTYSAKHVMTYFASVGDDAEDLSTKVLACNPVMESFGNAKTTRNDNSSRFGKYLALNFGPNGAILGAQMRTYLLEKSRVVYQTYSERNYHVLYYICAKRAKFPEFELDNAQEFYYTNQGGDEEDTGISEEEDGAEFDDLFDALKDLDMNEDVIKQLFGILAGILHLGNVEIQAAGSEASKIDAKDKHLLAAARLLGLDASTMVSTFTTYRIKPPGEDYINKDNTKEAAISSRDALSKHIYSNIFDWLVKIINATLSPSKEASKRPFIGVLDIYGFEHFQRNSYEQFCINYANEKLQNQFNMHVFTLEQQEYEEEEIDWTFLDHHDNTPCIKLIESASKGLFSLLDDECKLGNRGSDKNWAHAIHNKFKSNPHFEKPSPKMGGDEAFIVKHYADDVCYDVVDFLSKNKDAISPDHVMLVNKSNIKLMNDIFRQEQPKARAGRGVTRTGSVKAKDLQQATVSRVFQESLQNLMDDLGKTDPHFVRCIKPNDAKQKFEFNNNRVVEQLRACGVLETIRISAAGYPGRFTFADFLGRYSILVSKNDLARAKAKNKDYANVRLALTSRDLNFFKSLWEYVKPEKQPNGQMMVTAAKAFDFFSTSKLDPGDELMKIWTLAKDDANSAKQLMMKSEFYDACKYVALAQDYVINDGQGLAALDMTSAKSVKRVKSELGEKCQQPQFDIQLDKDSGPKRASVYVRQDSDVNDERLKCKAILEKAISPVLKERYQIGKTKLFFRAGFVAGQLEKIRARIIEEARIRRDAAIQMWFTRREYKRKLQATLTVQRYARGWIDRKRVRHLRHEKQTAAAKVIQKSYRSHLVVKRKRHADLLKAEGEKAAITIQRSWKSYLWRKHINQNIGSIVGGVILIQSCIRRWHAKRLLEKLRAAANDPNMLKAKLDEHKNDIEVLRADKQKRVGELKAELLIVKSDNEKLKKEHIEVTEELEIAQEEVEMVRGQLQELQAEAAEEREDSDECKMMMEAKIAELEAKLNEQQLLGDAESQKVLLLKGQLSEAREAVEEASGDAVLDLQTRLAAIDADNERLELEVETLRSQNSELSAELEIGAKAQIGMLEAEIATLKISGGGGGSGGSLDLDMVNADLKTAHAEIKRLQKKLDERPEDLTDKYAQANAEIARLTIRRDGVDESPVVEELRQQIEDLCDRLATQEHLVSEKTLQMKRAIANAQAAERDYQEMLIRNEMLEDQLRAWVGGRGNQINFNRSRGNTAWRRPSSANPDDRRRAISANASAGAYSAPPKPTVPRGGSASIYRGNNASTYRGQRLAYSAGGNDYA